MKGTTGYLVATAVFVFLSGGCLAVGLLERDMARAQEHLATMNYDEPEAAYDTAERYFAYGSYLPWVGNGPLNDVRARKAALKYWQQQYGEIVPQQPDPVGSIASDNVDLQLVVADAVYRTGQAQANDRQSLLTALNAGINGYLTVLKNTSQQEDAAFNYEYLVRLRDEVDKGRRKPGGEAAKKSPDGAPGAPPTVSGRPDDFKIYVPLDSGERQDSSGAGKAAPGKRKG